jgi:hypothetical protein
MQPVKARGEKKAVAPIVHGVTLPKPQVKAYTELFSPDELWQKWGKDHVPFQAEVKYNGFRSLIQKKGDEVSVFFEDAQKDRSKALVDLAAWLRKSPHDFILDASLGVRGADGRTWPRSHLMTLNADKPDLEGGEVVVTVFDVVYWDRDVHELPFKERRALLEAKVKEAGFEISQGTVVHDLAELRSAFKKYVRLPSSEGVIAKTLTAPYPWGEAGTNEWSKVKIAVEVKALVLEAKQGKGGAWNFRGGLLPGDSPYENFHEFQGEQYVDLGFSFNSEFKADPGDIVTFQVEEIIPKEKELSWLGALPVDVDRERTKPYTASQVVDLARRGNVLQERRKATEPSRTRCMEDGCKEAPMIDVRWADGRARAWWCLEHFKAWTHSDQVGGDPEIVQAWLAPEEGVPETLKDYESLGGKVKAEPLRKLGQTDVRVDELVERLERALAGS